MADHHSPDWVGPALGAAGTGVTALLAWMGVRFTAKTNKVVDPQASINEGFDDLLNQMRLELKAASRERNDLRAKLEEREHAWALEREGFRGEIAQLQAVAEGFERLLRRNGIAIPERKSFPHGGLEVVETTLRQEPVPGDD